MASPSVMWYRVMADEYPTKPRRLRFPQAALFGFTILKGTTKASIQERNSPTVKAGEWAAPPLTIKLPNDSATPRSPKAH